MDIRKATWCVIDTETTGVDIETAQVCEIAAVLFRDGKAVERRSQLLNPGIPIPESVSAIHGITDDMVRDKPTLEDIAEPLFQFIKRADVLVGYNALAYDFPLLRKRFWQDSPGLTVELDIKPIVDPLILVRWHKVGKFWKGQGRHRLGAVAERLAIHPDGRLHRATADCFLTGKILWRLLDHPSVRQLPSDATELGAEILRMAVRQQEDYNAYKQRTAAG